jgi:hypothetical protein
MENIAPGGDAPPIGSTASPPDRRDRTIAGVGAVLLLVGMPIAWFTDDPSTGDVIGGIVITIVMVALLAWIVLRLVPRERAAGSARATRTALILGVLALLATIVFWTGLPVPLGAGAIALGLSLRESAPPSGTPGRATAALALGAFAVVASFVLFIVG